MKASNRKIPKNGLLSGMILTSGTAATVLPLAMLYPPFLERFRAPLTPELMNYFLLSILLMALHKIESFWSGEYDQCPVYLSSGVSSWARNPRKAMFVSFVTTFIGMLIFAFFAFLGPPWHLLILTVWIAQGLHELHHSAKSLSRRALYPGIFTSVLFVATQGFLVFPRWHDLIVPERGMLFHAFYLAMPLVFVAFYLEDRSWTARTPTSVWRPA